MRLARFRTADGAERLGRVEGDGVVDVTEAAGGASLTAILSRLDELGPALASAAGETRALADVTLLNPIDNPQKVLAIGMNYAEHAAEAAQAGIPTPTSQFWFNKQVSSLNDPFGEIVKPIESDALDYEVELGVVIGMRTRRIAKADALSAVAGYVVANDVSVRDWLQKLSPTFILGKGWDTHGPLGPWLTTADEIADPHVLRMTLTVNGEVRQDHLTDDMIYDIADQISYLSTVMTLMPGDVLLTGTPQGIGAPTGNFLKPGDVVRAEIEGLGAIENRVVAE
ncbi:fumarylacetoacetate hydrolase family protein [Microbacterium sp. NPDC096154]|uniref:fumarylacetoacetate hydrolase family protein n=1 Tax=Microbacterium sp. NPDC096154 TaxID=3155549 RepID=UPI0033241F3F